MLLNTITTAPDDSTSPIAPEMPRTVGRHSRIYVITVAKANATTNPTTTLSRSTNIIPDSELATNKSIISTHVRRGLTYNEFTIIEVMATAQPAITAKSNSSTFNVLLPSRNLGRCIRLKYLCLRPIN